MNRKEKISMLDVESGNPTFHFTCKAFGQWADPIRDWIWKHFEDEDKWLKLSVLWRLKKYLIPSCNYSEKIRKVFMFTKRSKRI